MTPNYTAAEVAVMQQEAREALEQSERVDGLEKLRLINKAFPFAIHGTSQGLLIAWAGDGWSISDIGGFITKLERDDVCTMLVMIGMEAGRRGSVREMIAGPPKESKAAFSTVKFPPSVERIRPKPKEKISLADLNLDWKKS